MVSSKVKGLATYTDNLEIQQDQEKVKISDRGAKK